LQQQEARAVIGDKRTPDGPSLTLRVSALSAADRLLPKLY
jgi:hypothetical protein